MSYPQDTRTRIWDFLVETVDRYGYPPTIREIAAEVGIASLSTVAHHLDVLQKQGRLKRTPRKQRSIQLIRLKREVPNVEVLQRFLKDGRDNAWAGWDGDDSSGFSFSTYDWQELATALDRVIVQALDNETGWTCNQ